ncbi:biopolymer transporter ExbD [bacterium SCSIO 12696]|nr:biopolymer transporter ExbD [bacterium SCSIO 12696]
MKFKRQRSREQGVNLTPLIDVVFLLLIFFMVSTTFTKETRLTVELPEAQGVASSEPPKLIEILVDSEGNYSVNGKSLVNRQSTTIIAALEDVSGGDTSIPLVVTCDANASFQAGITAMDAAGQAGFANLSITTRRPEGGDSK